MTAMPAFSASRTFAKRFSEPSIRISPPYSGCGYTPARILISVDLPAPFSPTRAWISPRLRSTLTPSRALTPGKDLVMLFISSSEGAIFRIAFTAADFVTPQLRHCKLKIEKCKLQITNVPEKATYHDDSFLKTICNFHFSILQSLYYSCLGH